MQIGKFKISPKDMFESTKKVFSHKPTMPYFTPKQKKIAAGAGLGILTAGIVAGLYYGIARNNPYPAIESVSNKPAVGAKLYVNGTTNYGGIDIFTGNANESDMILNLSRETAGNKTGTVEQITGDPDKKIPIGTYKVGGETYTVYIDYNADPQKICEAKTRLENGQVQILNDSEKSVVIDRDKLPLYQPGDIEQDFVYRPAGTENLDWSAKEGRTISENPLLNDQWHVDLVEYDGGHDIMDPAKQTSGFIRMKLSRYFGNDKVTLNKDVAIYTIVNGQIANDETQKAMADRLYNSTIIIGAANPRYSYHNEERNRDVIAYYTMDITIVNKSCE